MKTHLPITEEQKNQILELFDQLYPEDQEPKFDTLNDGYHITISRMYNYIKFASGISTLQGYLKIAQILGCENGDEIDRHSYGGCPTCDYGSEYTVTLRFW